MSARSGALCTLDGRGYVLDLDRFAFGNVDPTRQGIDQGIGAGPASLSNEVVWRRVRSNWVGGAGQEFADLEDEDDPSSDIRFHKSSSADPWTRRGLTVGRPRVSLRAVTGTPRLAPGHADGNGAVWVVDGAKVALYEADGTDGTSSQLGTDETLSAGVPLDVASFGGEQLYVVNNNGSFGVVTYTTDLAHAALGAESGDMIAAVGTRLLAGAGPELFELSAAGAKTTIYTHWSSAFKWLGAVPANSGIYAWGTLGGTSHLFRLPISDASGAVDAPIPVGTLPIGEQVTDLLIHVGTMLIGTNQGLRVGLIDGSGTVTFGPLISTIGAVRQLAPAGRYVFVASAGGDEIWRVDPGRFIDTLVPAFAAESNVVGAGTAGALAVASIVTTTSGVSAPVVVVASSTEASFYAEEASAVGLYAETATVDLGWFNFGIGENLALDSLTVECDPMPGGSSHEVVAYVDTPETTAVLTVDNDFSVDTTLTAYPSFDVRASRFRIRLKLTADTTAGTAPVVRSVTLRASPAPFISDRMILPLILQDEVETEHGEVFHQQVLTEWLHLKELRDSRVRVTLVLGEHEATVRVESLNVSSSSLGGGTGLTGYDRDAKFLAGIWEVELITLDDRTIGTSIFYGDDETLAAADHYGGAYA